MSRPPSSRTLEGLSDDCLSYLSDLAFSHDQDAILDVVALSSCSASLRARLSGPITALRKRLPPPYQPSDLDEALRRGDADVIAPLLAEAMRRLSINLSRIIERLEERAYPCAKICARCGRRSWHTDTLALPSAR